MVERTDSVCAKGARSRFGGADQQSRAGVPEALELQAAWSVADHRFCANM